MANEVRLIDANALIEKAYWHGERPDPGNIYPDGVGAVDVSDIEDAPTIDPESLRPKGRWVYDEGNLEWACSECLCMYNAGYKTYIDGKLYRPKKEARQCQK